MQAVYSSVSIQVFVVMPCFHRYSPTDLANQVFFSHASMRTRYLPAHLWRRRPPWLEMALYRECQRTAGSAATESHSYRQDNKTASQARDAFENSVMRILYRTREPSLSIHASFHRL